MDKANLHGDAKLTPEQAQQLSKRLGEILGDGDEQIVNQNEKGEILNEEGLPIIDITEPVLAPSVTASVPILPEEPVVLPLWTLPSIELERRRAERNRVLDLLEEEERIEVEKDEEAEEDEKQKTAQKRREAAKQDIAGLKAARELQRKMGRALVRDVTKQEEKKVELKDSPPPVRKELKSRKSVSFALPDNDVMPPAREGQSEDGVDWGDVVPARLRPLKSAAPTPPASYGPMKTTVVERFPNTAATDCTSQNKDSDDESAPGSLSISEDETPTTLQAYDHHDDEESSEEDEEGDLQLEDEEYDFDKAQHQREIALEYYEKRNRIGAQAAAALTSHSHDADEDPWDQPEVPLDASITGKRPKPVLSRFKADQVAASASTSLGGSILPASQSHIIQRAIKLGKVEEGNLVGSNEPDSDEEDMRAILELLSKGEVENAGPSPPLSNVASSKPQPVQVEKKPRNKGSRFKLARNIDSDSTPSTPVSHTGRSSPKSTAGEALPTAAPAVASQVEERISALVANTVTERIPGQNPTSRRQAPVSTVSSHAQERNTSVRPSVQHPMIINSPSFAPGQQDSNAFIIDSPSFAQPSHPKPVITNNIMIIDSPSFQPPPGLDSRQAVIAGKVNESAGLRVAPNDSGKAKKVSRFAADRM